jgi:hypothetical protein
MDMLRFRRRANVNRMVAGLVLSGFVLLTGAPLCGSPSDADPSACCERHGCHHPEPGAIGETSSHGRDVFIRNTGSRSDESSAEDCCRQGDLTYPVMKAQSSVSAPHQALTQHIVLYEGSFNSPRAGCLFALAAGPSPPLRIRSTDLYTLHSAYRV